MVETNMTRQVEGAVSKLRRQKKIKLKKKKRKEKHDISLRRENSL